MAADAASLPERIRVLVVDDDEDDFVLIRDLLDGAHGYAFDLAWVSSYELALASALAQEHDVYLLDYRLGSRNGLDLAREIVGRGVRAPIMLLTGFGSREIDLQAMDVGVAGYLDKSSLDGPALERLIRYSLERSGAMAAIDESRQFLLAALNALSAHIAILDEHGWIVAVNDAWQAFAERNGGSEGGTGTGANYLAVCDMAAAQGSAMAADVAAIRAVMDGKQDLFHLEYPCHSPDARSWFVVRVTRFAHHDSLSIVVAHESITERKLLEERLAHQAFHDYLTGLPNRALLMERLNQALLRGSRRQSSVAVLFLDLDNFKSVNDTLGHDIGDLLLIEIARLLQSCLRAGDTAARLGGDEMIVLLEDVDGIEDVLVVADRVIAHLAEPIRVGDHQIVVTGSLGIALSNGGEESGDHLLRQADTAMYRAKQAGRNRYAVFVREMEYGIRPMFDHDNGRHTLSSNVTATATATANAKNV